MSGGHVPRVDRLWNALFSICVGDFVGILVPWDVVVELVTVILAEFRGRRL